MARQLLGTLMLLKQHKVIHCDLKPENILLSHPLHSEIRVIDFGSSCFENEKVYTYIQSRFYRSPEVILGLTYGMPIDMWSFGCILAEIFTGVPIFPGENELEQLACIMEVFGPPERHLIEKSTRRKHFFDSLGKPRINVSSKGRRRRPSSKTLQQAIKCEDEAFTDFLKQCLRWDQEKRLKPEEAFKHPFITGQKMPPVSTRLQARNESPIRRTNSIASTGLSSITSSRRRVDVDGKNYHDEKPEKRMFNRTIANFGSSVPALSTSATAKTEAIKTSDHVGHSVITRSGSQEQFKQDHARLAGAAGSRFKSSTNRPLPEPPAEGARNGLKPPISSVKSKSFGRRQSSLPEPGGNDSSILSSAGTEESAGASPSKRPFERRLSTINSINSNSFKRASVGPGLPIGTSSLPRAARNLSGPRPEPALAGAAAAMARRP